MRVTLIKRGIRDKLIAELPSQLLLADSIAADGITTPMPAEVVTTDRTELNGLPSLMVLVTTSSPVPNTSSQTYRHRCVVGITVGADDEDNVTALIERYVWATRRVLRTNYLPAKHLAGPIDTGEESYSPLLQQPDTIEFPFVKGAYIEVFVTSYEDDDA